MAIGQDGFEERQTIWQLRLDAIAEGLLRREFLWQLSSISCDKDKGHLAAKGKHSLPRCKRFGKVNLTVYWFFCR